MLAQKYCQKLKLNSFKEFQLVRERFLGELENSLRSLPSVLDIADQKVEFQDRLHAVCALLKEKYELEIELYLELEDFDGPETDEMSPEERDEFTRKMMIENGIVYDWIICCNYNRYTGSCMNGPQFQSVEKILSFWTQRDFNNTFANYIPMGDWNEIKIPVRILHQIAVSRESVEDWSI
jgi:hypothetical protein